jgi:hypothetical protein
VKVDIQRFEPGSLPTGLRLQEVIVEFDGPEIVLLLDDEGSRHLAVAMERNEREVLWLQAPISERKWRALVEGRASVRGAMSDQHALLVLRDHEELVQDVRRASIGQLDDSLLPAQNALLPTVIRKALTLGLPKLAPEPVYPVDVNAEEGSSVFARTNERGDWAA